MALKVGELFASFGIDTSKLGKDMSSITKKCNGMMGGFMKAGIAATAAVTAAVVGVGRSVMAVGQTFEATMSEVQAISGATAEEFKVLSDTAKEYGRTTKFTASEAGQALKYMALAGWSVEQSTSALGGVLQLAAASGMDLAAASDAVTDYLSAFGMEAEQSTYLADMMARAQSTSNTSAAQLADAYGNCAASMHAAGQDIETTTAALMIMANQGLKGSEAGTAMTAMMRDLTQKMKNGKIMIGKTAVSVMDANGDFRDLNDILVDIAAATDGMGSAQKSAALMTTFTARSIKGVNMLLNEGIDSLNQYEESLRSAGGTAADQSETMIGNLSGDLAKFNSAIEGLQIDIYESTSGVAREAVQGATEIIGAFNDAVRSGFSMDKMEGLFETSFDFLGNLGDKLFSAVEKGVATVGKMLPKLLPKLMDGVKKLLTGIAKNLPGLIKGFFVAIPDLLSSAVEIIPELADGLFSALGAAVEQLITDLPRLVPALAKGIGQLIVSAVKGAFSLAGSVFNGIGNLLKQAGLIGPSLQDAISSQLSQVDEKRVDELTAYVKGLTFKTDVDFTVDTSEIEKEIAAAIEDLKTTMKNIEGITEEDATALTNAILNGSGWDTVVAVFDSMDIPDGEAKAKEITNACEAIKGGIESLELPQDAINKVYTALQNGDDEATIQAILESYGVPSGVARTKSVELKAAANLLHGACESLSLPQEAITSVMGAINTNNPEAEIQTILESYGVPSGTASATAKTITAEQETITDALNKCGELPQKAINDVMAAVSSNAPAEEIKRILEFYNVDSDVASVAGESIANAANNINEAVKGIDIDDTILEDLKNEAPVDRAVALGAIRALRLTPKSYSSVVESWDTAAGTISGMAESLFSQITTALTDGIQDDPNDENNSYAKAIQAITSYFDGVKQAIDDWKATKLAEIEASGLTGDELTNAINAVNEQADSMYAHLTTLEEGVTTWTKNMANEPPKVVEAHMEELRGLLSEAQQIDAQIRAFSSNLNIGEGETHRNAVKQGLLTDQESVIKAMAYTSEEYDRAIQNAATEFATSTKQAAEEFGEDSEAYADAYKAALEKRNTDVSNANDTYNSEMAAILAGSMMGDEAFMASYDKVMEGADASESALNLLDRINAIMYDAATSGEGIKLEDIMGQLASMSDVNWDAVASSMGIEGGASDLIRILADKIQIGVSEGKTELDLSDQFGVDLKTLSDSLQQQIIDGLTSNELDMTSALAVFKTAAINGLINGLGADSSEDEISAAFNQMLGGAMEAIDLAKSMGDIATPEENPFSAFVGGYDLSAYAADASAAAEATGELANAMTGFSDIPPLPPEDITTWMNFDAAASQAKTEAAPVGEAAAQGIGESMANTDMDGYASRNISDLLSAALMAEQAGSPAKLFNPVGEYAAQGIGEGMANTSMSGYASQVINNLKTAINSALTDLYSIGRNITRGLAKGILDGKETVVNAAKSVAQAAADAMAGILEIGSPSRVAERYGRFFDEGFVKGVEGNVHAINNTIQSALSLDAPSRGAYAQSVRSSQPAAVIDYNRLADAVAQRPAVFNINGKTLARATRDDTARESNSRSRTIALGYGK